MSTDRQRDEGTDVDVRGPDRVDFGETLLEVDGLTKHFTNEGGFLGNVGLDDDGVGLSMDREWVRAVDDVSFEIEKGETLGLVGESGCGKSTLARTLLQLIEPTDGDVYFKGENLAELPSHELRERRKDMQIIFQDPQSSLDPRMKVGPIVEEPMQAHGLPESDPEVATAADVDNATGYRVDVDVDDDIDAAVAAADGVARVPVRIRERETDEGTEVVAIADRQHVEATATVDEAAETVAVTVSLSATKAELRQSRAKELLEKVGLDPQHYNRYPHQFSGGQRQRINLARALSVNPDLIVCDEPTSALDASIQAQVLNTMRELQEEFGLTYLFISHDLSVIRHISDRVAVMYLGHVVELADKEELFENPQHPYTESLLSAIPVPDPRESGKRHIVEGDVPSPIDPPSGCRFRTRCPELIAPEEFDFGEAAWQNTREFMRAVQRVSFEADTEEDVRAEFFGDAEPRGEAGEVVEEAISRVVMDEWDEAEQLLGERFADRSICGLERPDYDVEPAQGDGRHHAACHLHRDEDLVH